MNKIRALEVKRFVSSDRVRKYESYNFNQVCDSEGIYKYYNGHTDKNYDSFFQVLY